MLSSKLTFTWAWIVFSFLCLVGEGFGYALQVKPTAQGLDKPLAGRLQRIVRQKDLPKIEDELSAVLSESGYLDNRVFVSGDTITIDPGLCYKIGMISLSIVGVDSVADYQELSLYRGLAAGKKNLEQAKRDIVSDYFDRGYYFASLNTEKVVLDSGIADLEMRLIVGPIVKVERVRFRGLIRTRPEFARHLAGIREGDIFTPVCVQTAINRLESKSFLRNDSIPQLIPNENYDGMEVVFYLKELKSNSLELGGGYLPKQGKQAGEFVGRFYLNSMNLFGSGKQSELLLDKKDKLSSRIYFRLGIPFFVPDQMEVSLHLEQIDYDSSYHSFTGEGSLSYYSEGGACLTGGLSWTRTDPLQSHQAASRSLAGSARYEVKKFDYVPNPSRGRKTKLGLSYIRRTSRPETAVTSVVNNESMFEIAWDQYLPLKRKLVLRFDAETRVRITSRDLIDLSEQFKLGGYGSLRGYRQDQFAGRRIFLEQTEIRFRPSSSLAFYLFTDFGYVYEKKEVAVGHVVAQELCRWGSGSGLFIGSDRNRLTLELGWGYHDHVGDGKLHFGLTTLF